MDWGKEIRKQLIDQPLHMLWSGVSVGLVVWSVRAGLPPALSIFCVLVGVVSVAAIVLREYDQWPSSRWWDPPLDWLCFAIGGGLGGWLGTVIP